MIRQTNLPLTRRPYTCMILTSSTSLKRKGTGFAKVQDSLPRRIFATKKWSTYVMTRDVSHQLINCCLSIDLIVKYHLSLNWILIGHISTLNSFKCNWYTGIHHSINKTNKKIQRKNKFNCLPANDIRFGAYTLNIYFFSLVWLIPTKSDADAMFLYKSLVFRTDTFSFCCTVNWFIRRRKMTCSFQCTSNFSTSTVIEVPNVVHMKRNKQY